MAAKTSTITIRADLKDRLALVKGTRSWDDFMADVVEHLPVDDAIAEMERRLAELRSGKVKAIPWSEVKAKGSARSRRTR